MSNVLFIAEGCAHSDKLVKEFGTCLKSVCDRIYYYNPRDTNAKRKKLTLTAIEYHQIKRFPTLIWETSKRIVGERTISNALREACQLVENPQFTNLKPERDLPPRDRMIGNQPKSSISAPFAPQGTNKVNTADLGEWPSADQAPPPPQQYQGPAQIYQQPQPQQGSHHSQYPPQQQQFPAGSGGGGVVGLTTGYDPHLQQQQPQGGQFHGIGMGAMVGENETDMAQQTDLRGQQHQTENVGDWPTGKVQGLTGAGSMGGSAMMMQQHSQQYQQPGPQMHNSQNNPYAVRDQQQRMDLFQHKGQQNMQHANSMVNYGNLTCEPYR